MTFKQFFVLLLAVSVFAGCGKSSLPVAPTAATALDDREPKHAQPKLPTMKMYLGAEIIDAELAVSEEEIRTGMMFRTNIQDADTMLFDLRLPQRAYFWMKNCPESISAAYINTDGVIEEIHHLEKNDTNSVVSANEDIRFVLETSDGWFTRHHIEPGTVIRTEKGSLRETFVK